MKRNEPAIVAMIVVVLLLLGIVIAVNGQVDAITFTAPQTGACQTLFGTTCSAHVAVSANGWVEIAQKQLVEKRGQAYDDLDAATKAKVDAAVNARKGQ